MSVDETANDPSTEDLSVLSRVKPEDLQMDPFPHLIVRDPLPADLARRLTEQYPPDDVLHRAEPGQSGSNKRVNIYADDVSRANDVPLLWQRFIAEQSSPRFFRQAMRLFAPAIRRRYPELAARLGDELDRARVGLRFRDQYADHDVLLDAGISINTPVTMIPTSVREVHLDLPTKLMTGLFYLRPPDDQETRGGDLQLCRYRDADKRRFWRYDVDPACTEAVKEIPYENNVFVMFLNSIDSLHEVTPRQKTTHTRRFVNLVMEMEHPLFDGTQYQTAWLPHRARYYARQLFSWMRI